MALRLACGYRRSAYSGVYDDGTRVRMVRGRRARRDAFSGARARLVRARSRVYRRVVFVDAVFQTARYEKTQ